MLNILIFGPPGSGKGTQSVRLAEKFNLYHVSTGEMLRTEIENGTQLGMRVKDNMDNGELVPDDIVIEMISSVIDHDKSHAGYIYDGFPRTVEQARELDVILEGRGMSVDVMITMEVSQDELVKRLAGRSMVSGRQDDQKKSVIENRIEVYRSKTKPLIGYYRERGLFVVVDGMGTVEDIFARLCDVIEGYI